MKADKIFLNGKVYIFVDADLHRTVQAIAVWKDRILAVGTNEDILAFQSKETRVYDLKGAVVYPGFTDAHLHVYGLGKKAFELDVTGTRSIQEIQEELRIYVNEHPNLLWILGRGWDQNDWSPPHFPTHESLDRIVSDRPVVLTRVDGHAIWVNSKALELAGITAQTPDPEGGKILRFPDGRPTGILVDQAMKLVRAHIPPPTFDEVKTYLHKGLEVCARYGLTEVHDAGIDETIWKAYLKLGEEGKLPVRVYAMAHFKSSLAEFLKQNGPIVDLFGGKLTLRAVKAFADGALGSRGAALFQPYADDPDNRGLLMFAPATFERELIPFARKEIQVNTHAIGDRAIHVTLSAYALALGQARCQDCRWRIEHAQHIAPDDIPKFARFHILPSMQPYHAVSDMPWVEKRLGRKRLKGSYAWKSLIREGSIIPAGSDAPVESPDPRLGLYAALTRQTPDGQPPYGWLASERVTKEEALLMYTKWPAFAGFQEFVRGSIRPFAYADLTVVQNDFFELEPEAWLSNSVLYTIVGGDVVFSIKSK